MLYFNKNFNLFFIDYFIKNMKYQKTQKLKIKYSVKVK